MLIWAQTVFYPVYDTTDAARGLNALSDQNLAGGLMMVEEIILTTLLLGWLFYRFARQDEERQELLDLAAEHGDRAERRARGPGGRGRANGSAARAAAGGASGLPPARATLWLANELRRGSSWPACWTSRSRVT